MHPRPKSTARRHRVRRRSLSPIEYPPSRRNQDRFCVLPGVASTGSSAASSLRMGTSSSAATSFTSSFGSEPSQQQRQFASDDVFISAPGMANSLAMGSSLSRLASPAPPPTLSSHGSLHMDQAVQPHRTAAEMALAFYGEALKLESLLCKRLANEPAIREPIQRRPDQKLNIERRSNVEALMAHITGVAAVQPCKNCAKGHGPWNQCILLGGHLCGSCANCWFNASGSRCTFHESNHPQSQTLQAYGAPLPTPPLAMLGFQVPPNTVANRPAQLDIERFSLADATGRHLSQAIGDSSHYSERERHVTRIEAAAKELGMRIAKYDEYLRTPQGLYEQQRAHDIDRQRAHSHHHGVAPEASMDDSFSSDGLA